MASRKIKRKKAARKPDEFISAWAKIVQYFYENQLFFYIAVSTVIALAIGVILVSYLYFHRQAESQEILNNGITLYRDAGNSEEDLNKALLSFTTVSKKYPLSKAKKIALLYQGSVLFDLKKYDEALDAFTSAEKRLSGPLKSIATENIGYCYEKLGNYGEASEVFKRLISPENENAYIDLIRNLEMAGKEDEALTYANDFLTYFPDSSHAPVIEEKLGEEGGD